MYLLHFDVAANFYVFGLTAVIFLVLYLGDMLLHVYAHISILEL